MDDLISRAAALDAVDGMKPMQGNMEQLAMKALCWAAVKSIPAVDAVPVEYIKDEAGKYEYGGCIESAIVIEGLISSWQKEQEAGQWAKP